MNGDNQWHLSKSVPISIIIGFVMQFAGFIWYTSQIDAQVKTNTDRINRVETQVEDIKQTSQMQAVQLGRIEENLNYIKAMMERMLAKIQ